MAVVTSELTRVELAGAASAAQRAGRIDDLASLLDRVDADCGVDGLAPSRVGAAHRREPVVKCEQKFDTG